VLPDRAVAAFEAVHRPLIIPIRRTSRQTAVASWSLFLLPLTATTIHLVQNCPVDQFTRAPYHDPSRVSESFIAFSP
jgi:hypothetical protein